MTACDQEMNAFMYLTYIFYIHDFFYGMADICVY